MDYTEERVDGEQKYKGVIVNVSLDRARLCDGRIVKREVVEHPGGVTILPVDDEGNCYLVRQFRYPAQEMLLEAAAGKLEYGEDPLDAAVRELSEETGYTADEMVDMGFCYSSPGFCTEKLHFYLALGLHEGPSHPDDGEFLNVEKMPLTELVSLCESNSIIDAKTQIIALRAEKYIGKRKRLK